MKIRVCYTVEIDKRLKQAFKEQYGFNDRDSIRQTLQAEGEAMLEDLEPLAHLGSVGK